MSPENLTMPTKTLYGNERASVPVPPPNHRCSLVLAEFLRKELGLESPRLGVRIADVADALDAAARAYPNLISLRDPR